MQNDRAWTGITRLPGILLLLLLSGCASPLLDYQLMSPAAILLPVGSAPVKDGRTRFREIFCTLLAQSSEGAAGDPICEDYLLRLGDEPTSSVSKPLPAHDTRLRFLLVPGALGECYGAAALPYPQAVERLRRLGYRIDYLPVEGRSGASRNASLIAEWLQDNELEAAQQLVLVGYSKGASDGLLFLAVYPELAHKITALVSIAGSINGSPLANRYDGFYNFFLAQFAFDACGFGDGQVIESLKRDQRMSQLVELPPPRHVAYYSLGAFTEQRQIARIMRLVGHPDLSRTDPRNDGQTLYHDQVIPEATLLGYANADHWAVAIPMEEAKPFIAGNGTRDTGFPRRVLFEAIVLYLVESLGDEKKSRSVP